MLKEQSQTLQRALFVADLVAIAVAWIVAFYIRFRVLDVNSGSSVDALTEALPFTVGAREVPLSMYLRFLPGVLVLWGTIFLLSGLYQTRRAQRLTLVVFAVARAVFLGLVASVAATFFYRTFAFSRVHMLLFGMISSVLLVGMRMTIYVALRRARQQGRNVRRVLIVGAGEAGKRLANAFQNYPWMGIDVVGFLDDSRETIDLEALTDTKRHERLEPKIIGTIDAIGNVLDTLNEQGQTIDLVYAALPLSAAEKIEDIANAVSRRTANMCLVPDLLHFDLLMNCRVSDIDGLPVIHLIDEAPFDIRQLVKRGIDICFSALAILLLSPLLLAIALAVKLSSRGPVFYKQERMGLNGQKFTMLKFRSMPVDAETNTGAVWAEEDETRATRTGAFLRKTSLDELPQFFNVLKGDMSVVGPRPERPVFIENFRHEIPGYMLRHKMKTGITGWAQVNGWRGNTSLEKRIQHDLYYIQNWSLWLDVKIMALTLVKGFVHDNAY